MLHAGNQKMLAYRTLALIEQNGDRLTDWTKSDAKKVTQQAEQEEQTYENGIEAICNLNNRKLELAFQNLQYANSISIDSREW
jgi:hypothetical protein